MFPRCKICQNEFAVAPDPAGEAYSAPPGSLVRFKRRGGRGRQGRAEDGRERMCPEGKGEIGKGGIPVHLFAYHCIEYIQAVT